jgi:hypothetical protein
VDEYECPVCGNVRHIYSIWDEGGWHDSRRTIHTTALAESAKVGRFQICSILTDAVSPFGGHCSQDKIRVWIHSKRDRALDVEFMGTGEHLQLCTLPSKFAIF